MQRGLPQKVTTGMHIGSGGDQRFYDRRVITDLNGYVQGRLVAVVVSMHIRTRCDQRFHDARVVANPSGPIQGSPTHGVAGVYVCSSGYQCLDDLCALATLSGCMQGRPPTVIRSIQISTGIKAAYTSVGVASSKKPVEFQSTHVVSSAKQIDARASSTNDTAKTPPLARKSFMDGTIVEVFVWSKTGLLISVSVIHRFGSLRHSPLLATAVE